MLKNSLAVLFIFGVANLAIAQSTLILPPVEIIVENVNADNLKNCSLSLVKLQQQAEKSLKKIGLRSVNKSEVSLYVQPNVMEATSNHCAGSLNVFFQAYDELSIRVTRAKLVAEINYCREGQHFVLEKKQVQATLDEMLDRLVNLCYVDIQKEVKNNVR